MTETRQPSTGSLERSRTSRPEDRTWRADALAGSRHSRWVEQLREPLADHDLDRAQRICGAVTRLALRDLAPALLLLDTTHRLRVQAITAYSLTLFDFVRQTGLEGERLSAINRWEFTLDSAFDGRPTGQPVFVLLAALEARGSWDRRAFDLLHACARRRCAAPRPVNREVAEEEAESLGLALGWLVAGEAVGREATQTAAAMLRARSLVDLGDDLRRHRCRLPVAELPDNWSTGEATSAPRLRQALRAEVERLRPLLRRPASCERAPADLRRALRYGARASLKLLAKIDASGDRIVDNPPHLGLLERLLVLVRCHWR